MLRQVILNMLGWAFLVTSFTVDMIEVRIVYQILALGFFLQIFIGGKDGR